MDLTRGKSGPLKHLVQHESKLCTLKKCIVHREAVFNHEKLNYEEKCYCIYSKSLLDTQNLGCTKVPSCNRVLLFTFSQLFSLGKQLIKLLGYLSILIVLYIQGGNRSNRKRKEVQSLHKLTKLCIVWSLHKFHSKLKLGRQSFVN